MQPAELARQQNGLLELIFTPRLQAPSRGLAVYRANAHANAERALQAAYPIMAQLVGQENFGYLARDFWHQCHPQRGDLAQWGAQLPLFLANSDQLLDTPYLADVAHLEWALHTCAGVTDQAPQLGSFMLLTQHAPEDVALLMAPAAQIHCSPYPAAAMVLAHQDQGTMDEAAGLLQAGVGQNALVWRQGMRPRLRTLGFTELGFCQAVCDGQPLASALDKAHEDFDFTHWLADSVQRGLVLGAINLTIISTLIA